MLLWITKPERWYCIGGRNVGNNDAHMCIRTGDFVADYMWSTEGLPKENHSQVA